MRISIPGKGEKLSATLKFKDSIIMLHLLLRGRVSSVHLSSAVSLGGLV